MSELVLLKAEMIQFGLHMAYELVMPWVDPETMILRVDGNLPEVPTVAAAIISAFREEGMDPSFCPSHLGRG